MNSFEDAPLLNTEGLSRDLGRVMIVAPHPDDESLGCGGLIAKLTSQNAEVHILFMTNGEASHPGSKKYTPKILGELRVREAMDACRILGVKEANITFLNAGDGRLCEQQKNEEFIREIERIVKLKNIETIFSPWRRDHHIDHISTTVIIYRAVKKLSIIVVEYPIWLWKKGNKEDWPISEEVLVFRLKLDHKINQKLLAIQSHKSQTTKMINDDPDGFILTEELLKPFLGTYEYFFFPLGNKAPVRKKYFEELYKKSPDPWNFKHSPYEQEKYKSTLDVLDSRKFQNALELGCSNGIFTSMLSPYCNQVLGVDLSEQAIKFARTNCTKSNCTFLNHDISKGIPGKNYDLIILSEVGYYFDKEQLRSLYSDIIGKLVSGGMLVLVHWTAYVRQYPLTGLQVHQLFKKEFSLRCKLLNHYRAELYELLCWQKVE